MKIRDLATTLIVPGSKIHDYALNPQHPQGKNKAVLFARLGYTQVNAEELRRVILQSCPDAEAVFSFEDDFGAHYHADFSLRGPTGLFAQIRTTWMRPTDEDVVRLTSLWVRKLSDVPD